MKFLKGFLGFIINIVMFFIAGAAFGYVVSFCVIIVFCVVMAIFKDKKATQQTRS